MEYDLERLQLAARNYDRLQTLPWAFVGGMLLLCGSIQWLGGGPVTRILSQQTCWAAGVFVYLYSWVTAKQFYERKYGTVFAKPVEFSESMAQLRGITILALGVLCIFIIPAYFPSLVNRIWLIVGAFLIRAELHKDFLAQRIVAGVIFVGLSVAPLLHWVTQEQLTQGMENIVSGVALLIIGLADYWVLVRSLPAAKPEESRG